jgi:hypothetical protein
LIGVQVRLVELASVGENVNTGLMDWYSIQRSALNVTLMSNCFFG